MATKSDVPPGDDRPGAALAGPFLHQRAAYRSPRPGGRIDELDAPERPDDGPADHDAPAPAHSEEDDAG